MAVEGTEPRPNNYGEGTDSREAPAAFHRGVKPSPPAVWAIPPAQWDAIAVEVDRLRAAGLIPKPSDGDQRNDAETQAAIEADLDETHPDMRPCGHCGKPQRDHSYLGDYCLPHLSYSPVGSVSVSEGEASPTTGRSAAPERPQGEPPGRTTDLES